MLVKLTPGANFINILLGIFGTKVLWAAFLQVTFWLCNFLAQEYQRKSYS